MRVLFIHNYYQNSGGEDVVFEQEVAMLREYGITVECLLFNNNGFDKGTIINKLKIGYTTIYNVQSIKILKDVLENFKPNIVHIHNLFYTASPAIIKTIKDCGIPVVMTLHNYRLVCSSGMLMRSGEIPCEKCTNKILPFDGIRNKCFRESRLQTAQLTATVAIHKLIGTWKRIDKFIVLTNFAREKILNSSLRLLPSQIVVKPNAVPDYGYNEQNSRENFFLYVGRLSQEKGIRTLIQAAKEYNFTIKIIGDGPLRLDVENAVLNNNNIKYLGQQPKEVVVNELKKSSAVIVPSICYEGLPTIILEAFSTGTVVIHSDSPNLNLIVNESGYKFKTNDSQSLIEKVKEVQETEKNLNKFNLSRALYIENYTEEAVLQTQLKVYKEVIRRK
ncbi:glycosyltransferase [Nibrella saemangeumensis]|uniref:Glycosyltransferase n=1 Tax=Nibrella saemangeumensis TaxID=1084526 RepID=A0ABP8N463_9BACT